MCLDFFIINNYQNDTIRIELDPYLYFNEYVCNSIILEYYLYADGNTIVSAKINSGPLIHSAYIKNYRSENKTHIKILMNLNPYYTFWSFYITKYVEISTIDDLFLEDVKIINVQSFDEIDIKDFKTIRLVPYV